MASSNDFLIVLDRRYRTEASRYLRKVGFCGEDVDDVINRLLVAAWRAGVDASWWRDAEHEKAWVWRVLLRQVRAVRRNGSAGRFRMQFHLFSELEKEHNDGLVVFQSFMARCETDPDVWQDRRLLQVWETLAPKQRQAIEMVVLQEMGYSEAGRLVGSTPATIHNAVRIGLDNIRMRLVVDDSPARNVTTPAQLEGPAVKRHRRAARQAAAKCLGCEAEFQRERRDQQCCSVRCRMTLMRARRRLARMRGQAAA